jgi:hypothetical protein
MKIYLRERGSEDIEDQKTYDETLRKEKRFQTSKIFEEKMSAYKLDKGAHSVYTLHGGENVNCLVV